MRRIEKGDHYDTAKVIGNCKSSEENLESDRNPCLEYRKNTERECDISCHRDSDTSLHCSISRTYKPEEKHRNSHTSACAYDRKKGLFTGRKFTNENLTLDLQTYGKEEDRHKEVVDNLTDSHRVACMAEEIEVSEREAYRVLPK